MTALAPFRCAFCPRVFPRFAAYADHVQATHPGRGTYLCDTCRRAFPSYAQWEEHHVLDHREKGAPKTLLDGPAQLTEAAGPATAKLSLPERNDSGGVRQDPGA